MTTPRPPAPPPTIDRVLDVLERVARIFPPRHPLWLFVLAMPLLGVIWLAYVFSQQAATNWTWDDEGVGWAKISGAIAAGQAVFFGLLRLSAWYQRYVTDRAAAPPPAPASADPSDR